MEKYDWIAGRSQALAIVYLTRREDVTVKPQTDQEWGTDLVVFVNHEDRREERKFGAFYYGTNSLLTEAQANKTLTGKIKRELKGRKFPYPVCLFDFSMVTNEAFYAWLA